MEVSATKAVEVVAGVYDSTPMPSNFAQNVLDLLSRTEYRRCDKGEDLEAVYRLRYKSYLASGMVSANHERIVTDGLDDLPNSMRFGIHVDGELVSTLRLHHVTPEHRRSPSTTVYGDLLHPRIDAGETFIDPSRFAADPDWTAQYPYCPMSRCGSRRWPACSSRPTIAYRRSARTTPASTAGCSTRSRRAICVRIRT